MKKLILIFDKGNCIGCASVGIENGDLISVFTLLDNDGQPFYFLYVADMEYGIVVSKEIYDRMNKTLDAIEEED